jgi:hypothetical protein
VVVKKVVRPLTITYCLSTFDPFLLIGVGLVALVLSLASTYKMPVIQAPSNPLTTDDFQSQA